jgi:hypothetical protein
MSSSITYHSQIPRSWLNIELFHTPQLLSQLQQPTVIKHPSKNPTQNPRWLVTLQHANESSGLYAFLDTWKRLNEQNIELNHDLYFLIVNGYGATAKEEYPLFSRRFAPNQIDFNRCWTKPGELGRTDISQLQKEQITELTNLILQTSPGYIIDIHNTTGDNNPLAYIMQHKVSPSLVNALVDHIIYSGELPGSIMHRFQDVCETLTVECGKTGTFPSFLAGRKIIDNFIRYSPNQIISSPAPKHIYQEVGRLIIKDTVDFIFSPHHLIDETSSKLFLRPDIEQLNQRNAIDFGPIGFCNSNDLPIIFEENGKDQTQDILAKQGNAILITKPLYGQLFTTNSANIRVSELGYLSRKL